ncbi:hypothetical protein FOE78_12280 [Microlunatus elymi]|uniref:Uncharacterized protein n=1 Tax=Microlunatus elymi TaxID=2596828 RepID=A0A516PZI3_9ACTN|nr:hypothetical protein [Microlunatus elymi]QDP96580.1 hypothetical protein FOE78_12280 [Microlunatus elymi]
MIAIHGYDTKFAMHALRLGFQGVEFATTGRISLPIPEPVRGRLRAVRRGEIDLAAVLAEIAAYEQQLTVLLDDPQLPDCGDLAWLNDWLIEGYETFWTRR